MRRAEIEEARQELAAARDSSRDAALRAVAEVQGQLVAALGGEVLRGLPNLLPDAPKPLLALRVNNSRSKHGASEYLPRDGREVLVLLRTGELSVAARRVVADEVLALLRPPLPEEIVVEDLEPLVELVCEAIDRHIALSKKRTAEYRRIGALAERIRQVIGAGR